MKKRGLIFRSQREYLIAVRDKLREVNDVEAEV